MITDLRSVCDPEARSLFEDVGLPCEAEILEPEPESEPAAVSIETTHPTDRDLLRQFFT